MKKISTPNQRKLRRFQWAEQNVTPGQSTTLGTRKSGNSEDEPSAVSLVDYYTLPFTWLHGQLPSNLGSVHGIRKSFWHLVPHGLYLDHEAQGLVLSYAKSVEGRLAAEITKHSISYWIHVYRRLAPYSIGNSQSQATVMLVRGILEAAFQKYGLLSGCNGIGWSTELKPEEVLSGVPDEFRIPTVIEQFIGGPRQQLLTNFGLDQLIQFYECEKLAYELWRCGATLRIISKGAPLIVDHEIEACFFDGRSEELNQLVVNYDDRPSPFIASAAAAVFRSSFGKFERNGYILLAQYNVEHKKMGTYASLFKGLKWKVSPDYELNFEWKLFDLGGFCKAHRIFTKTFLGKHGFRFEVLLLIVMSLFYRMAEVWSGDRRYLIQAFQRAYSGPSTLEDIRLVIRKGLEASAHQLAVESPSEGELEKALLFLILDEQNRSGISLITGGPKYLFLPAGDGKFIVDYAWLSASLHYLFLGVPFPQHDLKGKMLEALVGGTSSVLPDGECKSVDGESREFDAAFGRGKILVIVECKANAKSIGYERGDFAALEFRRKKFEKALDQVDDKARWLSLHSSGTNYDVRGYEAILPVVVTPFKEFMPSLTDRYWIRPEFPRVITPDELETLLSDKGIEDVARKCTATLFIPLSINTTT